MDKWALLKTWVAKRHDYLEAEYRETNVSSDGLEMGVFRKVFEAVKSLEEQERAQTPPESPRGPSGV